MSITVAKFRDVAEGVQPGQFMTIWGSNVHGVSPAGGLVSFAKPNGPNSTSPASNGGYLPKR